MTAVYFWKPETKEVLIYRERLTCNRAEELEVKDMQCLDTWHDDELRYGYFSMNAHGNGYRWDSVSFSDFSPEFRTHLLLLGVT